MAKRRKGGGVLFSETDLKLAQPGLAFFDEGSVDVEFVHIVHNDCHFKTFTVLEDML